MMLTTLLPDDIKAAPDGAAFSLAHWPVDLSAATKIQNELRAQVRLKDDFSEIDVIAGVDVSYNINSNITNAFIVLMHLSDLKIFETVTAGLPTDFPYIPGFLSFREIPAIMAAMRKLTRLPDLLMVDGQGVAHPRRLGIASHLGVLLNLPAIGVAKSRLTGKFTEPGQNRGDREVLTDKGEVIGAVLRSKPGCNPLFISAGHRVSQKTAVDLTINCLTRYRLPEPTRMADKLSKEKAVPGQALL